MRSLPLSPQVVDKHKEAAKVLVCCQYPTDASTCTSRCARARARHCTASGARSAATRHGPYEGPDAKPSRKLRTPESESCHVRLGCEPWARAAPSRSVGEVDDAELEGARMPPKCVKKRDSLAHLQHIQNPSYVRDSDLSHVFGFDVVSLRPVGEGPPREEAIEVPYLPHGPA